MKIAVAMMQKDEDLLIDGWCRYYGNLFGYENMFIFDNGSTDAVTIETLQKYARLGVNIDWTYTQAADFFNKGEVVGSLFKRLQALNEYDIFLPLDCDEFISVSKGGSVSFEKRDIFEEMAKFLNCPNSIKMQDEYLNSPEYSDYFYSVNMNKTMFAAPSFRRLDHGHHLAGTYTGEWSYSRLAFIHFHNKPFSRIVSDAKRKLLGFNVDIDNPQEIEGLTHSMHLKKYFRMTEDEFYRSFDSKCHIKIDGFTQRMVDLGVKSTLFSNTPPAAPPPILLPPNFDCERYLFLNPDVAESNFSPARHYMLFGASEGRDCPTL